MAPGPEQEQKAERFRALHQGEAFIIPNPWDAGSARALEALGFQALATTSSGFAFTLGRADGRATLDEVIDHVRALEEATSLPISADLENGHGPDPEDAAVAVARAAEAGAVGASIEDYDPLDGIYGFDHAVERVAVACEAAKRPSFPFTFTARAENHIRGNPDLGDTIARLQAYERAGADVLYAPGLRQRGRDPEGVRGDRQAGQRARPPRAVDERDRGCRCAAGERWRLSGLGRRQGDGSRRRADARRGRLLRPARAPSRRGLAGRLSRPRARSFSGAW